MTNQQVADRANRYELREASDRARWMALWATKRGDLATASDCLQRAARLEMRASHSPTETR